MFTLQIIKDGPQCKFSKSADYNLAWIIIIEIVVVGQERHLDVLLGIDLAMEDALQFFL